MGILMVVELRNGFQWQGVSGAKGEDRRGRVVKGNGREGLVDVVASLEPV